MRGRRKYEKMNIINVENITKSYTGRKLFSKASFYVQENEKIGIIGINGTGKSTLLKIVAGDEEPDEGTVTTANHIVINYLPQNPEFDPDETALEHVMSRVVTSQLDEDMRWSIESDAKSLLMKLDITDMAQKTGELSGGQRKRLALATVVLKPCDVLILDEPTNHLDIFMRETLTDALSAYTGTLLLVTHDRYLMQTLGCPILYLEDGKATFYQNFQKLHDRDTSKQPEPAKQEDKPQKAGYGKEQRRRRAEVRTRLKALETEIEELGAHIVELENEINDPEVLRDHLLLRDKCDELDDSRFHQQELYDEWEKLAEEQDRMDAESDS